jgi:hypothetical protein
LTRRQAAYERQPAAAGAYGERYDAKRAPDDESRLLATAFSCRDYLPALRGLFLPALCALCGLSHVVVLVVKAFLEVAAIDHVVWQLPASTTASAAVERTEAAVTEVVSAAAPGAAEGEHEAALLLG